MSNVAKNSLVSVIMPAYNAERFIVESVDSVLAQSYSQLELIIIVDGGHDGTKELVVDLARKDSRIITIFHQSNVGIAKARNSGLDKASGRYIAFCDSDDVWLPNKLETQLAIMRDNNVAISHTSAVVIDGDGRFLRNRAMPERVDARKMAKRNFIINSSAVVDRTLVGVVNQQDVKHEDYDMWLRLFQTNVISLAVKRPLVKYRVHSGNTTSSALKSLGWMIAVQRKNDISWLSIFLGLSYNLISRLFSLK